MKTRKHRKKQWWFIPHEDAKLKEKRFRYKKDLMEFLTRNYPDCIYGEVVLHENSFSSSSSIRAWLVDTNLYEHEAKGAYYKIVLKQRDFQGRKYIFRPQKIKKSTKKWFSYSTKLFTLMSYMGENKGKITENNAKNFEILAKKAGFVDFSPSDDDKKYIEGHLSDGIDFWHWSDRLNYLRIKTILEYFKRNNLLK